MTTDQPVIPQMVIMEKGRVRAQQKTKVQQEIKVHQKTKVRIRVQQTLKLVACHQTTVAKLEIMDRMETVAKDPQEARVKTVGKLVLNKPKLEVTLEWDQMVVNNKVKMVEEHLQAVEMAGLLQVETAMVPEMEVPSLEISE